MNEVSPREAKHVLHSLLTSGQPPKWGARLFNVGTDNFLNRLKKEYLEEHCLPFDGMDGGGACKWVEADYGNGKTQFLRCVQEVAWELDYLVAYVELSQDECPLDRPDRVYGAVARSLQARPSTKADLDQCKGIDAAFAQLLDLKFPGSLTGVSEERLQQETLLWLDSLNETRVESTALRTGVTAYLRALLQGDGAAASIASSFIRGEILPAAELKKVGVYEKLDQSKAFMMLRSLCQLVQRSGLASGIVLLFDEARRTLSLMSTKQQKVACENLLSVINKCNSGDLPGTLFIYAVMPEFFTNFAVNYPALQQRCTSSTRISLNHLKDIPEIELLAQIGEKITALYVGAYEDFPSDEKTVKQALALIPDLVLRKSMGTGTRRSLVKCWVQLLQDFRENGIRPVTQESLEALVAGTVDELSRDDEVSGE